MRTEIVVLALALASVAWAEPRMFLQRKPVAGSTEQGVVNVRWRSTGAEAYELRWVSDVDKGAQVQTFTDRAFAEAPEGSWLESGIRFESSRGQYHASIRARRGGVWSEPQYAVVKPQKPAGDQANAMGARSVGASSAPKAGPPEQIYYLSQRDRRAIPKPIFDVTGRRISGVPKPGVYQTAERRRIIVLQ